MGAVTVVRLGAWCDFVTEDEYRQRLVRHGEAHKGPLVSGYVPVPTELPSQGEEVENLVEDFKQGISFVVHEFAELADGRRLTLHEERGFTTGVGGSAPSDMWRYLTLEHLERDVRTTVPPDDDDTQDEHLESGSPSSCTSMASRQQQTNSGVFLTILVFSERLRARLGVT